MWSLFHAGALETRVMMTIRSRSPRASPRAALIEIATEPRVLREALARARMRPRVRAPTDHSPLAEYLTWKT
jgi:DNA-binding transcriptional regulator YdaS (Cro superfamily)